MNVVTWVVRLVILVVLILLAIPNTTMTRFTLLGDIAVELPLIVLLFGFLALGVLFGVLILLPKYIGLRWSVRKLNKEVDVQKAQLASLGAVVPTTSDVPQTM